MTIYGEAELSGLTRAERFKRGLLHVEDLDDEELARGEVRGPGGRFTGRQSKTISRELHTEMKRRLFTRGDQLMQMAYLGAVQTISEIAMNPNNAPSERLQASKMILERVRGKEPVTITFKADDPIVEMFRGIAQAGAAAYEEEEGRVIDAEVVDDELPALPMEMEE